MKAYFFSKINIYNMLN